MEGAARWAVCSPTEQTAEEQSFSPTPSSSPNFQRWTRVVQRAIREEEGVGELMSRRREG